MIILYSASPVIIWKNVHDYSSSMFKRILTEIGYHNNIIIDKRVDVVNGAIELVGTINLDQYLLSVDNYAMSRKPKGISEYFDRVLLKIKADNYITHDLGRDGLGDIAYHISVAKAEIGLHYSDKNEIEHWINRGNK